MRLTADQFAKTLISAGLSTADEVKAFWSSIPPGERPKDGETFATKLIAADRLSKFQAEELLSGSQTPLVLGDYVLLGRIGAGGMGQVFKAQHRHMERLAAIKLLPKELTQDAEAIKRFQREVKAAAKLSHPNIVQTYDAGVQKGVWYLVMEYVEGCDLAGVVSKEGPLPVELAVDYMRQAAKGLAFAHESGVVHRDIKPANLLVDKKGIVKILDMGLARIDDKAVKAQEGLTQSGQVMGTVDYMAPEQAFNVSKVDGRADIYSLGCTLYRLLTSRNLFDGESMVEKLMAHQTKPIPKLATARPDAPAALVSIFEKMVAKLPDDRYKSMADVETALAALLSFPSPQSQAPSPSFFQSLTGGKPAAAVKSQPVAAPVDGTSPTISLQQSHVTTDPVSERSIQVARENTPRPTAGKSKTKLPLLIGGGLATVLLLLGIWVIIRDKDGKEVARVKVPDGGTATIESPSQTPLAPARGEGPGVRGPAPPIGKAPFDAATAKAHQEAWATYLGVAVETQTSVGGTMVLIPPSDEVTKPYFLGKYEVTQAEWEKAMDYNPSQFKGPNLPVEYVNWFDGIQFCNKLSEKEGLKPYYELTVAERKGPSIEKAEVKILGGNGYKLPTDPEWTWACAAGAKTKYHFGDSENDLLEYAWFNKNSDGRTHQVGEKKPNSFGLYDIHGNVREWNEEILTMTDTGASERVSRGGPWYIIADQCKVSYRYRNPPAFRQNHLGLRVARAASVEATPPPLAKAPFDAKQAKAHQEAWAKYLGMEVETKNSIGMQMTLIPPGEFLMGSSDADITLALKIAEETKLDEAAVKRIQEERPQHRVRITQPFRLAAHEVTIGQFAKFVEQAKYKTQAEEFGGNSSTTKPEEVKPDSLKLNWRNPGQAVTDDSPVTQVSWNDAVAFCNWLSGQEQLTPCYQRDGDSWTLLPKANGYRLPTEAEWEYCCRAGTTTQYSFGDNWQDHDKYGWTNKNAGGRPHSVGLLPTNPFGLHDMHGNVWEWCQDWYDGKWYDKSPSDDPIGPTRASHRVDRVYRSGGWSELPTRSRSSYRNGYNSPPSHRYRDRGFRPALSSVVAPSSTSSVTPQPADGWTSLFNGRDLSGWRVLGFNGWAAVDGVLVGKAQAGQIGWLMSDTEFDDFEFETDYKLPPGGNSGVFLRAWPEGANNGGEFHEVQLFDDNQPEFAKIAAFQKNLSLFKVLAPDKLPPLPLNEWHKLHIVCYGLKLQVSVDGQKVLAGALPPGKRSVGRLGLQLYASEIAFRNLRVRPLTPDGKPRVAAEVAPAKPLAYLDPMFGQWLDDTQKLPAEQQIEAVSKKLVELNPGFDGKLTGYNFVNPPEITSNAVTCVSMKHSDPIIDISPLRALSRLNTIRLGGNSGNRMLLDLSPLKDLPLTHLNLGSSMVSDLSMLKGMKLEILFIFNSPVADLSPLQGMPLVELGFKGCGNVSDFSLLESFPRLKKLNLLQTKVTPAAVTALQKALPNCKIEWDDPAKETMPAPGAGSAPPLAVAPFDAKQARAHQEAWAKHIEGKVETTNSVGAKLILIPPGEFLMGSSDEQVAAAVKMAEAEKVDATTIGRIEKSERPQHKIVISKPFLLGQTEVTLGQFKKFVAATGYQTDAEKAELKAKAAPPPPSVDGQPAVPPKAIQTYLKPGYPTEDDFPVTVITWNDAAAYCNWLSEKEQREPCYRRNGDSWVVVSGEKGYRLPTEAEWEYACRAGTTTQFSAGDDPEKLEQYGWFKTNSGGGAHAVAGKLPNPFGVFDMHGNAYEWCQDFYDETWYERSPAENPMGPNAGTSWVERGGSWYFAPSFSRSSYRYFITAGNRFSNLGFRVVLEF